MSLVYAGRFIRSRTKSASDTGKFSGEFGGWKFHLGAGSAATMAILVSVLWAACAVYSRPKLTFQLGGAPANGIIKSIAKVSTAPDLTGYQLYALRKMEENSSQEQVVSAAAVYASVDAATQAVDAAKDAADTAAAAADAAVYASADAADTARDAAADAAVDAAADAAADAADAAGPKDDSASKDL